MRRASLICVTVSLVTLACGDLFGPSPLDDTVPLDPIPAQYWGWWDLVEQCSGIEGDLNDIRWLISGENSIPGTDGAAGVWLSSSNSIVLISGMELRGEVVRHEMLHALLRRGGHPRSAFIVGCAGIVSCGGRCENDAGGPLVRDMNALVIEVTDVVLTTQVLPTTVSLSRETQGCMTVVVSATNHTGGAARVRLAGRPHYAGRQQSFGWSLEGIRHGAAVEEDTLMPFLAGETRRHVFDCVFVGNSPTWDGLAPGSYEIAGHLRSNSMSVPITIVP